MRLIVFLIFVNIHLAVAVGHAQRINIYKEQVSLRDALHDIRKQSGYNIIIDGALLKKSTKRNITLKNASLTEALSVCLDGLSLGYEIHGKNVVIKRMEEKDAAKNVMDMSDRKQQNVSGSVVDAKGTALPGISVAVKGKTAATATDGQGRYSIQAQQGDVLVFSSVGYADQEVTVSGGTVNVTLDAEDASLDEVVVIGYGTQKKTDVIAPVSMMSGDGLEERPVTRVDQALVGQMAGVHVKQTTGVPGKGFSVQVRGAGSITAGSEPLYVIDGFPLAVSSQNSNGGYTNGNPLDNINPNDIESIQVLKDASAAAIYGSRASNGVVLITTKKGKSGTPKINVNAFTGISKAVKKIDLLSGEEWMARATEVINAQWEASGPGRYASQTTEERRNILGLADGAINTQYMLDDRWAMPGHPGLEIIDWQDELFRTAHSNNIQLSASGGTDVVKYYVSGNYADQEGTIVNQRYRPISGRANVEVKPSSKLVLGMNLAPTYSELEEPGHGGGSTEGKDAFLHRSLIFTPVAEDYMGANVNAYGNDSYRWGTRNNSSAAIARETIGLTKNFRTLATFFGEYELLKNLKFKTTFNLDYAEASKKKFTPYTVNGNLSTRLNSPGEVTRGSFDTYRLKTMVNENTLTYNTVLNSVHDISALAGFSYNHTALDASSMASSGGFTNIYVTTLNGAAAVTGNTTENENTLVSWFGRLQYAYNSKYLFSVSARRDGSSRFGINSKWGWFPSASVGWRISEEAFMEDIPAINDLKLRGSWGKSGNNNIGDYTSISTLGSYNYSFGGAQVGGLAPDIIADPNLSWEKSNTFNVGLDAAFLKSRITASFDYYTKKNTDLLLYVPIVSTSGFRNMLTNIGAVNNKGWEVEISTRNLTGAFQWNTSLNLAHNTNEVSQLGANNAAIEVPLPSNYSGASFTRLEVGLPINSIFVIHRDGVLTQADIDNHVAIVPGQQAGDPRYVDFNEDGVISAADRQYSGQPNPTYVWGITNNFRYKNFDLSVLLQGQNGGSIYSLLGRAIDITGVNYTDNQLGVYRDRWTEENPNPRADRGKAASSNFSPVLNTDWLYKTNYWRIRNITAGYNFKPKVSFFNSLRVFVTMENWFGHDSYYGGYNPEAETSNVSGDSKFPIAADYGGMPLPKSVVAGINVTF